MTRKLLTVDEFRASAQKEGARIEGTVVRFAAAEPEAITDGGRKVRFIFSDGSIDHSGDSIDPAGWEMETFDKNPVALWAHDSFSPPIGRASGVGPVGSKLMGDIEFMPADISPFADTIYRMVLAKFVRAVSVGFLPLEWSFAKDKDRPYGIDFKKQLLLEISLCPIPCNPNALQEAKSAGIDTAPLREWASRLLDEGNQILVPRNVLEETFRQAKTPRAIRQKYLAASETPEWKAGAAADLPIVDVEGWDGALAAKRMLDDAGFDGETPDPVKAARGFLVHDAANPLLRSSYKLPFADVVDGTLKAIKAGVIAVKGRLDQKDAVPADMLDAAKGLVDGYEGKFGDVTSPPAPAEKSGRRISSANEAKLREALGHHESASQCIKDVLATNADGADPENDGDGDEKAAPIDPVLVSEETDPRAKRLAEVKALRASLGL